MIRWLLVGCCLLGTTSLQAAPPLLHGTLWWMPYLARESQEKYAQCISEQCDVGFNLLWILNSPALVQKALENEAAGKSYDPLEVVFRRADERRMRVMIDLPQEGWYGKAKAEDVVEKVGQYCRRFFARYGKHPSFAAWYLNYEINPLAPDQREPSQWWRTVWREETAICHRVAPHSFVSISPFFILDKKGRISPYVAPEQYGQWWAETLRQTKIDVVMLQDSGAEHLALFSLADREPFWKAMQTACRQAGCHFWLNVESGELALTNWEAYGEYLAKGRQTGWQATPIDRLTPRLALAGRYAEEIVNWGYFPFAASAEQKERTSQQQEAYQRYKTYRDRLTKHHAD
jgi:hypothetical protein